MTAATLSPVPPRGQTTEPLTAPPVLPAGRALSTGIPPFPTVRMSVEQFEYLIETGFYGSARVELWDGWVVERMSHGPVASTVITKLNRILVKALDERVAIRVQLPIRLTRSFPEPDLAVFRGTDDAYVKNPPTPADALVLIEVSDSTLTDDRRTKLRMYANSAIAEYWIINCVDRQVEIYTEPATKEGELSYDQSQIFDLSQTVTLQLPDQPAIDIPVATLFGQA